MKILIVGGYPKPYGGNTVHISRLREKLIDSSNTVKVLDFYGETSQDSIPGVYRIGQKFPFNVFRIFRFMFEFSSYDVFHFHVSAFGRFLYVGFFFMFFVPKSSKTILTIHSGSFSFSNVDKLSFREKAIFVLIKCFTKIITVNSDQKRSLVNAGINENVISVIPAFIPSNPIASDRVLKVLDDIKSRFDKVIVTSGYMTEVYGYDQIINSVSGYCEYKVSILICHYSHVDEVYKVSILDSIKGLDNVFLFDNLTPEEFAFLLSNSDLYIRATDRDGDAVAIREAISFGVPVIASDVVARAPECVLYEYGNSLSLLLRIQTVFSEDCFRYMKKDSDYSQKIFEIYRA